MSRQSLVFILQSDLCILQFSSLTETKFERQRKLQAINFEVVTITEQTEQMITPLLHIICYYYWYLFNVMFLLLLFFTLGIYVPKVVLKLK